PARLSRRVCPVVGNWSGSLSLYDGRIGEAWIALRAGAESRRLRRHLPRLLSPRRWDGVCLAETPLRGTALTGSGQGSARVLVAEIDAPFVEIIGRHLDGDLIPSQDADAVLLHAPRGIGDHLMPVVELDPAARIRKHLGDDAFELQHLFFGHALSRIGD